MTDLLMENLFSGDEHHPGVTSDLPLSDSPYPRLKVTSVIRLFQGEVSGRVQASSTRVPILCDDCLGLNDSWDNVTGVYRQLPPNLRFNSDSLIVVIVYSILFVVAAVGNLSVFISLVRSRHRKSRMSMVMTHLTIADLIVTFLVIPLEIGWRITVQWIAGNAACKIFLFFRAFGLYLSSNVLVCVSLDRYFAVLHPLKVSDARRRGKVMLAVAWAISFMCSVPQSETGSNMSLPTNCVIAKKQFGMSPSLITVTVQGGLPSREQAYTNKSQVNHQSSSYCNFVPVIKAL
ncbi:hypothetical protein J6590_037527 [Homalodisca vitripennis]|nr:hypothetical protein J6590_037527 [Homalodisca vitripennis]